MVERLGFAGDVMLGRLVDEAQQRRDSTAAWGSMGERLRSLDGLVINLECCLSSRGEPWPGRAFHFRADPGWAVPALRRAGVDACALANNHILDYGDGALRDTIRVLDDAGIRHTGAGATLDAAIKPAVFAAGDATVAVVSFTDNTPEYAAGDDEPGTAYVEVDVENAETRALVTRALDRARDESPDVLVASLHWGPNMREAPSDAFRAFARWLVDEGVDVVHGHSAHVFQGVEVYCGRPILYDTGDFVDDYAVDDARRNDRSFLFEVTMRDGIPVELRLVPTEIRDRAVHAASSAAAAWSCDRMRARSAAFGTVFDRDGDHLTCRLASGV